LACPIVDSLEGVSHALRTTEYDDRNDQYRWIQKALNLRCNRIQTFSRVNFSNTLLSKRKLTWFVENGYVTGWDDARFPTVRGVVRRGINVTALREFMYSQGASRRVVNMVWHKFWAENKKEIDKRAKRFMAIDGQKHKVLRVTDGPKEEDNSFVETQVHPKDASLGNRLIRLSDTVLLEAEDVEGVEVGETIVLLRWGKLRCGNGIACTICQSRLTCCLYLLGVVKITTVGDELEGTLVPDGDFKAAKRKLSWLAKTSNATRIILTEFDNLISKEKLEETDKFEDFINPDTLAETEVIGDAGLKSVLHNEIIQLERRGYYRVDRPYICRDKPLVLYMIPDGKSKAMSGLAGQLAHR
jgi:tRNA synthetases class I (E and Q), catalytic domain/tRNA synthetases class I (E and Q), anti-codon binding domain